MKISFQIPSQLVEFHRAMDYDPRGQYFSFDILRIKYLSVSEFSCSAASRCIKLYQMIMFYLRAHLASSKKQEKNFLPSFLRTGAFYLSKLLRGKLFV